MTAKEYFSQLPLLEVRVQQMQEEREFLLERATSTTAALNPVKVQSSPKQDRTGTFAAEAADLQKQIDKAEADYIAKRHEMIEQIHGLGDERNIQMLFKVHIQGKSIRRSCSEMRISYRFGINIHKRALAAFEEMYSDILKS